MKITMTRDELLKVLEMEDITTDICKALNKPVPQSSLKDSMQMIYDLYDSLKASNRSNNAVKFHINFKSRENFLWIEINPDFIIDYMDLYYSYIKELITPGIAIIKATKKLIEKNKLLCSKYNNF